MEEAKDTTTTETTTNPQPAPITMVCSGGFFLIGKIRMDNGGEEPVPILIAPRVFTVIDGGKRIQLSPLPGMPTFIFVSDIAFSYPIPDTETNLLDLYEKVTKPPSPIIKPSEVIHGEGKVIKMH